MKKGLIAVIALLLCTVMLATAISGCRGDDTEKLQEDGLLQNTTNDPKDSGFLSVPKNGTEPMDTAAGGESLATEPEQTVAEPVTEPTTATEPELSKPTEPKPTEPTPTAPISTEPEPTAPVITEPEAPEPKPTQPPVTEPPATEPPATEPAEVIDLDALVQYGLNYAADTHGYRISPGVRAGYYPAYTCVFDTMEEGKTAIRGCVDDTTRALLAVPGTQIAVEIDGVMCRAKIDIVIVQQGEGVYLVNVFYG